MKTYLFSFLLGCAVGVLYGLCRVKKPRADAEDAARAARLWAESEKIVQALQRRSPCA